MADISYGDDAPSVVNVSVEITRGMRNKYETDEKTGRIVLDRVNGTYLVYPLDYGEIPGTLCEDGDPLDALIVIDEPVPVGVVVPVRPIGVLYFEDDGEKDEKLITVAAKEEHFMNKNIIGFIIVIIALAGSGFAVWNYTKNKDQPAQTTPQTTTTTTPETETAPELKTITVAEVATHNSASSCWTIIQNNVYDVTEFIASHPGGEEILRACGTDGTTLFTSRTTEEGETVGSGTPHSSNAEKTLQKYQIGVVEQ